MTAVPAGGRVGVVIMAYGTPATPADVEPYYTHIRRGRPPSPEQLANLQMRYDALGGTSTLAARTAEQVATITAALERLQPGRFVTALGQKHAFPFIEDGVASLAAQGVDAVVGVVLAPHFSGFSVGEYQARVREAAATAGLPATGVERWHDLAEYRTFLAGAVAVGLRGLPARTEVVFTAHSLPERVLDGDPYPDELRASAEAAATMAGIRHRGIIDGPASLDDPRWSMAWQSAGATPEPTEPTVASPRTPSAWMSPEPSDTTCSAPTRSSAMSPDPTATVARPRMSRAVTSPEPTSALIACAPDRVASPEPTLSCTITVSGRVP